MGYDDDRLDVRENEDRTASLSLLELVSALRRQRDELWFDCERDGRRKKNPRRKVVGSSSACVSLR